MNKNLFEEVTELLLSNPKYVSSPEFPACLLKKHLNTYIIDV
ncbi:hypothetical protein [Mycoplasmopsis felis]|nr:hypothetical protein [Mycoplasmopsis felis]